MKNKSYTIGLDIGTATVGWAVIDEKLNLVKGKKTITEIDANGKRNRRKSRTNLWGVRLFEEGDVAADRRLKRGMRRRIARRAKRLAYLRAVFEQEILSFDESFFIRMDESFYQNDDDIKTIKTKYPLFNGKVGLGESFDNEVDYYRAYPTIYHLRKRLVENKRPQLDEKGNITYDKQGRSVWEAIPEKEQQADLRLVYLALHHIAKFRGHFINQGQKFDLANIDIAKSLRKVLHLFDEATAFNFAAGGASQAEANAILSNRRLSKGKKAFDLNGLYKLKADAVYRSENHAFLDDYEKLTERQKEKWLEQKQKQLHALFKAIVGNGIDLVSIFDKQDYKPSDENDYPKAGDFKYFDESFDDKLSALDISKEERDVIKAGKAVYEAIVLSNILTADSLAASMVEKFESHKVQLTELKAFTKAFSQDLYAQFFKEEGIYSNYIQGTGKPSKTTPRAEFYKQVKKAFEKAFKVKFPEGDKTFDFSSLDLTEAQKDFFSRLSEAMKFESYLPKQRQSDNVAIPYQVHEDEIVKILENQGKYYPFLSEKVTIDEEDENYESKSIEEYKIQALFKFRIPYYVGTLAAAPGWARDANNQLIHTESPAQNSWLVRKSDEKLTPWNFSQVIDKEQSAVNFIERMTNFDTYLPTEKVLPKNSLLYQEFSIYNELITSGWYQDGKKNYFSPELRQKIVEQLFKQYKKVSASKMLDFLNCEFPMLHLDSPKALFGIDSLVKTPNYNTSFSSWIDLTRAKITAEQIDARPEVFEQIIKWQTIFEDKKILKRTIRNANRKDWGGFLSEEQVKHLAKKHYTGWGRLSQKLLNGIKTTNGKTIIENLKTENYNNFMRLLEDPKIDGAIKAAQLDKVDTKTLNYGLVEGLAGSPALKKGIWQSLQIISELEDYLGRESISKIVIEMSREHGLGRSQPRQRQIEDFYKMFKEKTSEEISSQLRDELKRQEQHAFDNEKLFLYFLQNGKCMYSGRELDLDHLSDYEVDHIVPQTYVKDDSLDNKVLVLKSENQNKGGDVPSKVIIGLMSDYWEMLAKNGQVSPRKLVNLKMGSIGDKQREGFIHRQLVENRQITKHVANILTGYFEGSDTVVLTPKSGLTSQFRKGLVYLPNPDFGRQKDAPRFIEERIHRPYLKNRDLNAYHHAHDAYLNALVANYVYLKFPELKNAWVYGSYERNSREAFGKWARDRKNKSLQLLSDMREPIWTGVDPDTGEMLDFSRDEVFKKVERTLDLRLVNLVKKTERQLGKFGDESIYKKDAESKSFSSGLKAKLDPKRYGGTKKPISAFTVIVKLNNGKIKSLSVSAMSGDTYLKAEDKLEIIKKLYPNEKIKAIVIPEVKKFSKFENEGVVRLLASYQEAIKADALTLSQNDLSKLEATDGSHDLSPLFDRITSYLEENQVYNQKHLDNWKNKVREEFLAYDGATQAQFIKDAFSISSNGTTKAKGLVKGKIGAASGQQQHKSSSIDVIHTGTVLISQSITGLKETRRVIE